MGTDETNKAMIEALMSEEMDMPTRAAKYE